MKRKRIIKVANESALNPQMTTTEVASGVVRLPEITADVSAHVYYYDESDQEDNYVGLIIKTIYGTTEMDVKVTTGKSRIGFGKDMINTLVRDKSFKSVKGSNVVWDDSREANIHRLEL